MRERLDWERVIVGRGVYVGRGVVIGDDSNVQNYALVCEPAETGCGVCIGPGVIPTNDRLLQAVTLSTTQKTLEDWTPVGVRIMDGASISAGAICIAPLTIGRWAIAAAGSVVTRDVFDHALVAGSPARQIGWVGRAGVQLETDSVSPSLFHCPSTGEPYEETGTGLVLVHGRSS